MNQQKAHKKLTTQSQTQLFWEMIRDLTAVMVGSIICLFTLLSLSVTSNSATIASAGVMIVGFFVFGLKWIALDDEWQRIKRGKEGGTNEKND